MKSRIALLGAMTGSAVLVLAGPAFAHVTVEPTAAQQGSYAKVVFKAPNERDNASTTKLEVNLPAGHPIASVQTEPVPGWQVKVVKTKLAKPLTTDDGKVTEAVTKVTWSGGKIEPGSFQEFPLSLGPLPTDTGQLVFKALQTYSSGEVVRWIQQTKPGQDEPENPAPVLTLTKKAADGQATTAAASGSSADTSSGDSHQSMSADSSDSTARTLGIAGIVVGAVGIATGVLGWRRRSSADATSSD